jgi:hypothetical protein
MSGIPKESETGLERELPEKYRGLKIFYPEGGSPYFFNPETGTITFISPPDTRPVTIEDVLRQLQDFP